MADELEFEESEIESPEIEEAPQETPEAPVTAPETPVEDEVPFVAPDWLYEESAPPREAPQQYQQEPQYQPPQQYQQPQYQYTQPPPQPGTDAALNAFVENPDAYIDRILEQRMMQATGPLAWQQQQMANEFNMMRQTYAEGEISKAKNSVQEAYRYLNTNPTFKSNKTIQESIKSTLKGYLDHASNAARMGDYRPMAGFLAIGKEQLDGMVAYLNVVSPAPSPGAGPLQVEGATVESSRSPVVQGEIQLTPDQEAIAARYGKSWRKRFIQGLQDADKYDDIEFGPDRG